MRMTVMLMSTATVGAALGLDWAAIWQALTGIFGTASAQPRETPEQALEDLTFRLRHPLQDAAAHPVVTLRRKIGRRQDDNV